MDKESEIWESISVMNKYATFLGMPAIVCSERMLQLMEVVRRAAQTTATVLITGETGSGKELIARALHHYSSRSYKPWVDVNCAALPQHLMESELFGYEKGAFSGADSAKQGLFELAHTGTFLLDEIGELDPKMQVKMLRVLDGIPYYRLGGVRKISVDVRILAATNLDLEAAVRAGQFRSDLYHRLSQIQINVPPLRERKDDIIPLAEFFLAAHDPRLKFSADAAEVLRRYPWPGNIRQVRNVVAKATLFAEDLEIQASDLSLDMPATTAAPSSTSANNLEGVERQAIMNTLAKTGGHQQKAADLLGISRRTLSRKLKNYQTEFLQEAFVRSCV